MNKEMKFNIITEGIKNGVSITCRKYNISRTIYYRWQKRYKTMGIDGLEDIKKNFIPSNKTSPEIEIKLFNLIRTYPSYGPKAIKYLLEEIGHDISESAVYNVMKRYNLTKKESRLKFARKKESSITSILPPLKEISSGECWIFWITDYGKFEKSGHLYEYTFFDVTSRIACTRLYNEISLHNFEELLTAVALPVAQSLSFNTVYLCLHPNSGMIQQAKHIFETKLRQLISENGFDVDLYFLNNYEDLDQVNELRKQYTESCLSFLLPFINAGLDFKNLKIKLQNHVRTYNIIHELTYTIGTYSPVEFHNISTDTKPILPLWAYIDREY